MTTKPTLLRQRSTNANSNSTNAVSKSALLILACAVAFTTTAMHSPARPRLLLGAGDRIRALRWIDARDPWGEEDTISEGQQLTILAMHGGIVDVLKDGFTIFDNAWKIHNFNENDFELLKPTSRAEKRVYENYVCVGTEQIDYGWHDLVECEVLITLKEFEIRENERKAELAEREARRQRVLEMDRAYDEEIKQRQEVEERLIAEEKKRETDKLERLRIEDEAFAEQERREREREQAEAQARQEAEEQAREERQRRQQEAEEAEEQTRREEAAERQRRAAARGRTVVRTVYVSQEPAAAREESPARAYC